MKKNQFVVLKMAKFGEFWSEHSEVSKICILIGPFYAKYITFDLSFDVWSTEELSFMKLKIHEKFEKTDLWFGKWHEEFGKFSSEHLEVSKFGLWWDRFVQSRKWMSKNLQRSYELWVMWHWRMTKNLKRSGLIVSKLK